MSTGESELELGVVSDPVFVDAPAAREHDYLAVIEAAYDLTSDDGTWLLEIVRAAWPILDRGFGVAGFFWDISQDRHRVSHPTFVGCSPKLHEAFMDAGSRLTAAQAHATYLSTPCKALGDRAGREFERAYSAYRSREIADCLVHVSCADVTRKGCALTAPRIGESSPPAFSRALNQISRHVVAGMRLRRSFRADPRAKELPSPDAADAVLDPTGRLLHAESPARGRREGESLIDAVRRLLESQRIRRSQPEHAVELWRALVLGRWSLIHHQDSDGKRFLLARHNAPDVDEPGALKEDERRAAALFALLGSVKLVAYELGLAESTVSERLKSAVRKLGCRDRAELIRILNPEPAPPIDG
jgi:DNA-binding CsgD family transcriptional regulator